MTICRWRNCDQGNHHAHIISGFPGQDKQTFKVSMCSTTFILNTEIKIQDSVVGQSVPFLFNHISGGMLSLWWVTTLDTKQHFCDYSQCQLPDHRYTKQKALHKSREGHSNSINQYNEK